MKCTFTVGTRVARIATLTRLVQHLRSQSLDLRPLDFEGHLVLSLAVSQVNIHFACHLDAVSIFSSNETNLGCMVLQLRLAILPSSSVLNP